MKIIDLLNKIANGEETPKSFKYGRYTFTLDCDEYIDNDGDNLKASICDNYTNLNDEIEIIEDKNKKIDNLDLKNDGHNNYFFLNENGTRCTLSKHDLIIANKVIELVGAVNYLLEKHD